MKVNATCLIGFFVLIPSLTAAVQAQPKEQKLTTTTVASDKYGKGGTLETTSDEKAKLVKEVWKDKNGKQKEVHILKHENGNEVWDFPGVQTFTYNPKSKEMAAFSGAAVIKKDVEPSQFREWMQQFGTQLAKDGTYSYPWNKPKETATSVQQPAMPASEVFKPKTDQPTIDPDRPPSPSTEVFNPPKNTNDPKKEEPKKEDPPKSDKTSPGSGGNTASTPPTFTAPGYKIDIKIGDGLTSPILTGPHGVFKVNIPGDVQPGEPFTGSIWREPAGKNDAEREKNNRELKKYSFELGKERIRIPEQPTAPLIPFKFGVLNHTGFRIILIDEPVARTQLPNPSVTLPPPTYYTIPTGAQQGSLFTITGPFDGNTTQTDFVEIGGERIPIVTESQRSRVVWNTSKTTGASTIKVGENGQTGTCPFHNVSVKLSAPNLSLLKGQTTLLTVVVSGLDGLKQDVPFELVNHSPGVVSMDGGNQQSAIIHPSDLQPNGTYTTTRTLRGVAPGGFNITATVQWKETCKPPMEVMRLQKSASVNGGSQ